MLELYKAEYPTAQAWDKKPEGHRWRAYQKGEEPRTFGCVHRQVVTPVMILVLHISLINLSQGTSCSPTYPRWIHSRPK